MEGLYRDAQLEAAALKPRLRRGRRRRLERRRRVEWEEESKTTIQNASADVRKVVQLSGNLTLREKIIVRYRQS
jgi:hypothetical protein